MISCLVNHWFCVCVSVLLLAARAGAGQTLLYSLTTGQSTPFPRIAKTEIFAVDVRTGTRRVVFSDLGLDWLLLPAYPGGGERQTMNADRRPDRLSPGHQYRFLPDGQHVFLTLDTGGDNATSKASFGRAGTYLMNADGSTSVRTQLTRPR